MTDPTDTQPLPLVPKWLFDAAKRTDRLGVATGFAAAGYFTGFEDGVAHERERARIERLPKCPRCGSRRSLHPKWEICDPCVRAEGWDALLAREAASIVADLPDIHAPTPPKERRKRAPWPASRDRH
jgi:hypothetical protein